MDRYRDVDSPDDSLRYQGFDRGAARFARAEGMWHGDGEIFFACTTGGRAKAGQLWRYRPAASSVEGTPGEIDAPGTLELFLQPDDASVLQNADNICQSPGGDLIVCEDGPDGDFLLGVTPTGRVYPIARNTTSNSEFAGCCFSPDGSTLFVNVQRPGLTLAITGPWPASLVEQKFAREARPTASAVAYEQGQHCMRQSAPSIAPSRLPTTLQTRRARPLGSLRAYGVATQRRHSTTQTKQPMPQPKPNPFCELNESQQLHAIALCAAAQPPRAAAQMPAPPCR